MRRVLSQEKAARGEEQRSGQLLALQPPRADHLRGTQEARVTGRLGQTLYRSPSRHGSPLMGEHMPHQ